MFDLLLLGSEERNSESDSKTSKTGSSEVSSRGKIENKDKRKRVNVKDSEDENNDDDDKPAKNKKKPKRKISGFSSSSELDDVPIDLIAAEAVDSDAEDDEENDDDDDEVYKRYRQSSFKS